MGRLENRVALISGAGSGIGRATAILFAEEGAAVVVADVDECGGRETVRAISEKGGQALFVRTDVSRSAEVERMVKATLERFQGLGILFNDAGDAPKHRQGLRDLPEEEWDRVIAINLKGAFLASRAAIPALIERRGCIINTASTPGVRVDNKGPVYSVSKAGLIALTKCLALELAPQRVRVNCLLPGGVDTPMSRQLEGMSWEERRKAWALPHPLGRGGEPEEIARAALFLATDESSFITGAELVIDGGHLAS